MRLRAHRAFAVATLVALAFAAVPAPTASAAPQVTGNAASGKKIYEAYGCYACHGYNGETGARVLVPSRSSNVVSESSFVAFLRARANLAPAQPSTGMPNYSAATLTDAQAKDLYAYVSAFKSNTPAVDEIPVFKQIRSAAQKPYKP